MQMEKVHERWFSLINTKSVTGREIDAARYVSTVLESFGMKPEWSWFPEDTEHVRPSVSAVLESGRPGKTMLLIGHIDTVDVSENWATDPFKATEIDGKVYGRGSMDMKGGIAAILSTLEYFAAHKDEFSGRLLACFVADEEGLSQGTYQLVAEDKIHADYAIMAECRFTDAAVGFRGRFSFEVTVKGKPGHASRYPEVGENALISAGRLAAAIEALPTLTHPHLKHGTWCVRYLSGGNAGTLVVPDSCYMFIDRYVVPGETEETCIAQMKEAAAKLGLADKADIRLKPRKSPYMKSFAVDESHELVTTLQKHFANVVGHPLPLAYDPSVCDSNIIAVQLGIPVITFGPSGGNMHGDNEYGIPEQVSQALEIYIRTVKDLLPA